jgi:hypothetical protein
VRAALALSLFLLFVVALCFVLEPFRRKPTHVRVRLRPPSRRTSYFLCLARESNQREATHTAAVAGEAGDCARALRRFADRPSLA